ncbi:MAG: hypothetical protein ABFE01_23530 [Phycisphaerales bacterium]
MLVIAAIVVVTLVAVIPMRICRDRVFICENTGSQKGYRQWCVGLQSGRWHRESHLERFMRLQHPSELTYRWTFLSGVGRNLLGRHSLHECGEPRLHVAMRLDWFDGYVDGLDDAAKLDLYHVLSSCDRDAIMAEEKKIEDALVKSWVAK